MMRGHGGGVFALARELGRAPEDFVDMSSNINPLGPPPGLVEHLAAHLGRIARLPEVDGAGACRDLAALLDLAPANVLAGAGTTQFIHDACAALATRRALVVGPTYADYADACRRAGIEHEYFLTAPENDFRLDLDALSARLAAYDTLFLCAPNNPTGHLPPLADIATLARRHPGTRILVDASYLPFAEPQLEGSLAPLDADNLLVLWSASKIFAIPGLRAGFLVAEPELSDRFRRFARPWPLDTLAQEAMRFLGENPDLAEDWTRRTHAHIRREEALLRARLADCVERDGLRLFPTRTSFVLTRLPDGLNAETVRAACFERGVLIRDCANFQGLDARFIRVSLKDAAANARLADILARLIRRRHEPTPETSSQGTAP